MEWKDKQPDPDEIKERFSFSYEALDYSKILTDDWRDCTTKKNKVTFEANSLQDVLKNFHTFLNTVGYSYVGKVVLESKDGTKTWTT